MGLETASGPETTSGRTRKRPYPSPSYHEGGYPVVESIAILSSESRSSACYVDITELVSRLEMKCQTVLLELLHHNLHGILMPCVAEGRLRCTRTASHPAV